MTADVLLLGASMAGIELHYRLRRHPATRDLELLVVDRQEVHSYIPLAHERLCRRGDERMVLPTRAWMEADAKLRWLTGTVQRFDPTAREATLASGLRVRGRTVVLALGSTVAAPEALPGAAHLHAFKLQGELTDAEARLAEVLGPGGPEAPHLLVVGGGITGVELAGELGHLRSRRPAGWRAPRVTLVQGGDRLLPHLGRRAARLAGRALAAQGVDVRLRTRLLQATGRTARLRGPDGVGEAVDVDLAFWAGGVRPPSVAPALGLPLTEDGWPRVDRTLRPDPVRWPRVFVCGDLPRVVDEAGARWPTMQRFIECYWQAETLGRIVAALEGGRPPPLHALRRDFFHGVSVGAFSMVTYGPFALELGALSVAFRRFLLRRYLRRYEPPRRRLPAGPRPVVAAG